jgi:hypothetical protein
MPSISPSARRAFVALAFAGGACVLVYGCGTDAVGVDACRQIESARCEAAPACTGDPVDSFGIRTEEQVQNCKTLYRDQCLHGMENTGSSDDEDGNNEPSDGTVRRCVDAIKATAQCKRDNIATMTECTAVTVVAGWGGESPCRTLNEVENLEACAFVKKPADDDDGDDTTATTTTGGGGGGGTGGSGGSGG